MTEKTTKRRQGQRGTNPKPICLKCDDYLQRTYVRGTMKNGKKGFIVSGWSCPSSGCDYVIKDVVELQEEEETEETKSMNEIESD